MKFQTGIIFFIILSFSGFSQKADTLRILEHLERVIDTDKPRNYRNIESLNQVATYIFSEFENYCDSVHYQSYDVEGATYKNVVASVNTEQNQRIIIGAHYDVCGAQDGADDNASGIAGLLEMSRLLKDADIPYRLDFVAYTLEEPPYFGTEFMGSYIHAKSAFDQKQNIAGVICLDMIGYYSDAKGSQHYPLWGLGLFYGTKGNFITAVNKFKPGKFAKKLTRAFKKKSPIEVKKFKGPRKLQGINFSDHLNYWNFGYSSVFITNSGFYRNENYHKLGDSLETLNIKNIALVVDGLVMAISDF